MGWVISTRYLQLEMEKNALGTNSEFTSFASQQHATYTPVLLILLKGINEFSKIQFSKNSVWIVPLLSHFILCKDQNIRMIVSHIYSNHINHIVLSNMKS
jgi:hypothetical protein